MVETGIAPRVRVMKPAKIEMPGLKNVKRWHADVSARPSAKA